LKNCYVDGLHTGVGDYVHFIPKWEADKFILTVRKDKIVWYDSVMRWDGKNKMGVGIVHQRIKMYGSAMPQSYWMEIYKFHSLTCSKLPNCLVVCWEAGDGWKELCEFLGKPIPNVPFPHLNSSL